MNKYHAFTLSLAVLGLFLNISLTAKPVVELGIDVLAANHFQGLQGKRLGLLTNHTGVNGDGLSTIDVLRAAPGLNLVALYAPEHGLYGAELAGDYVAGTTDARTGLPVYSLFGPSRKPTPEMLQNIDVLLIDLQDIGCRSYTYISSMGLAMEACGEAKKEFYVLDRPNPLSGNRVEGMPLDPAYRSFVGQWEVPYVHGLTMGELAYLIHGEKWITARPKLTVVPMRGWQRSMLWADTGLLWVPASPHIPTAETALNYVVTGLLGEFGTISNGVGYTAPFALLGSPGWDRFTLADRLNQRNLPGFFFRPVVYRPFYGSLKGQLVYGVQVHYDEPAQANLTNAAMYLIEEVQRLAGHELMSQMEEDNRVMFDKLCGGPSVRLHFTANKPALPLIQSWDSSLNDFRARRAKYLLYP